MLSRLVYLVISSAVLGGCVILASQNDSNHPNGWVYFGLIVSFLLTGGILIDICQELGG